MFRESLTRSWGAVIQILGDCFHFEYYLVSKNLDWLMIETDHNELLIVQSSPR